VKQIPAELGGSETSSTLELPFRPSRELGRMGSAGETAPALGGDAAAKKRSTRARHGFERLARPRIQGLTLDEAGDGARRATWSTARVFGRPPRLAHHARPKKRLPGEPRSVYDRKYTPPADRGSIQAAASETFLKEGGLGIAGKALQMGDAVEAAEDRPKWGVPRSLGASPGGGEKELSVKADSRPASRCRFVPLPDRT